ncbi:hypothetical protein [Mycobacterium avium]|uniref:hypothetical protein n=1 Tax=Mycobacterium avium TaxID=1764 RepID=UPI0010713767|nr:hypothetical protein [Mycobacterium avium]
MSNQPGEVQPEKARIMNRCFAACLQQIIRGFRAQFFVEKSPEKLTLDLPGDRGFSFDIVGRLRSNDFDGEVWIEGKAYTAASDLLQHYRQFVRRVALARLYQKRVKNDRFWFISSAPFGCAEGSEVGTQSWMRKTIRNPKSATSFGEVVISPEEVESIEQSGYEDLARSAHALILTPELMRTTKLRQFPEDGDSIWSLTKYLYNGRVPEEFGRYSQSVSAVNQLSSPDFIKVGEPLELPFLEGLIDGRDR